MKAEPFIRTRSRSLPPVARALRPGAMTAQDAPRPGRQVRTQGGYGRRRAAVQAWVEGGGDAGDGDSPASTAAPNRS
jgi:hypothetical protein